MPLKIVDKKRFIFLIIIVLAVAGTLIYFVMRPSKNKSGNDKTEERIYEVLIQPFDQESDTSKEGNDNSLKKGDVIVIFPEGHPWSESEKTSYLILKMKLMEEEADKLIAPETETIQEKNGEEDEPVKIKTIRAKKYRVNIESLNFDLQKFWENPVQPYQDKVFDNSLIQTK